jgi:crotonobetainyl-CoA:carnitine CoA-transferase CaiB-like acyl-CoA transferase
VAGGWIHDEVIDADRDGFETALMSWFRDGPERVAAAAQELRWPVTPYRPLPSVAPPVGGETPVGATASRPAGRGRAGRRPPVVVDLTTHWAGPLATSLLAEAGAEVVKVDPEVRPDGFRSRPRLYHHLNRAKEVVDLDLREAGDRHRFEVLVAGADLLVESFSRRVLPNLGYDRDLLHHLNPGLATLSVRAFPTGTAEADWLAYGPGVHAASGLGLVSGSPTPAPIAYPDLVAGVAAYRRGVELLAGLVGPGRPGPGTAGTAEISLSGAIAPLVAEAVRRRDPSGRSDGSERGRTNG